MRHTVFLRFLRFLLGFSRGNGGQEAFRVFFAHLSGLGLALVKKYCDINKANITVESMKGKGTTFKVIFPISNKV